MSGGGLLMQMKAHAGRLKRNLFVLYLAHKDPRVPLFAKIVAICVVAYAFSPIDLIPDFVPVLGYLDDLIIVPLGIALAVKLIPRAILQEYREKAEQMRLQLKPKNWITGVLFILIWLTLAYCFGLMLYRNYPLWR